VDSTFGDTEILSLALDFRHVKVGNIPELTVPIVNDAVTYDYKGYNYGLVVFPTEPQDQQTIDAFLGKSHRTKPLPEVDQSLRRRRHGLVECHDICWERAGCTWLSDGADDSLE